MRPKCTRSFENLENRFMLDGYGTQLGVDARLSLSFAPDGTPIGNHESELFALFSRLGSVADWQHAILKGFQTWSRHTNADVAVVGDSGVAFGSDGATINDERFGDVRIGAISMPSDILAVSIPTNEFVDGTWIADVVFNVNGSFDNLDDLFRVAVHEAGHVFGLEHVPEIESPMHMHGIPSSVIPTTSDLVALHGLFGFRRTDSFEETSEIPEIKIGSDGTLPGIIFGDISSSDDADVFRFEVPSLPESEDDYVGVANAEVVKVELITDGISLLDGNVTVETHTGTVLGKAIAPDATGRKIVALSELPDGADKLLVRVAANDVLFDVGAYTVTVTYPAANTIDEDTLNRIARERVRSAEQDDFERFFLGADDDILVDDDQGTDDDLGSEVSLSPDDDFPLHQRYSVQRAISNPADVDRFRIPIPATSTTPFVNLTLSSLSNGFRGELTFADGDGNPIDAVHLTNNRTTTAFQLRGVTPESDLLLIVGAAGTSTDPTGNYEMSVLLNQPEASVDTVYRGAANHTSGQIEHRVQVGRTQLVQLGVAASSSDHLRVQVLDSGRKTMRTLNTPSGELVTNTVLLHPGEYFFVVENLTASSAGTAYELRASTVDSPLGPGAVDPTLDPFCGYDFLAPYQCEAAPLPGDINGDNVIGFLDLLILSANFRRTDATRAEGDLNGDGTVDFVDLLILSKSWGET